MSEQSLGTKTGRGVAMMVGATLAGKLVSGLGQIVLALLLLPEEFGLVALAFTVMSFSRAMEQLGLREILIREQDRFDRWVNSAMWVAGAVGILGMLVTAAFAPIAPRIFDTDPTLTLLILVLAPASPLLSMAQICEAKLERDMRYARVTSIQMSVVTSQMLLAILFAALGFGALSFVLPRPITGLARLIYTWRLVRPRVKRSPQFHRWPKLMRAGLPVMGTAILMASMENADYVILGLITTSAGVGFYYFAFMQSTQLMQVFSQNLMRVFVPSLSTLKDDPQKQTRTYLRGIKLLGLGVVPLCVIQAACAAPLLRLLFGEKWVESIPLLQLLSISAAATAISWPLNSLMLAQGLYTLRLICTAVGLTLFLSSVTVGALIGEEQGLAPLGAAIGVLAFRVVWGPTLTWIITKRSGARLSDVLPVYAHPAMNAAIAIGSVWWASVWLTERFIADQTTADIVAIAIVLVFGPALLAAFMRLTQPKTYHDLMRQGLAVLPGAVSRRVPNWIR